MANNFITFDGSTGFITVPDDAALNFGVGDFSISLWVNDFGTTGAGSAIAKKINGITGWNIGLVGGTFTIDVGDGGDTVSIGTSLTPNIWTHLVFTADRSGVLKYYKNFITSGFTSMVGVGGNISNGEDLRISNNLDGSLDDFRLHKSVLSAAHVEAIYNNGRGKKYTGAAGEGGGAAVAWNIDEGLGTDIIDEVAALTGAFTGGVSWQTGGAPFNKGSVITGPEFMEELEKW